MKRLEPKQRGLAVLAILLVATSLAATVTEIGRASCRERV